MTTTMKKLFKSTKPLKPAPYTHPEPIDPPTEPSSPPLHSHTQSQPFYTQSHPPAPPLTAPRRSPTRDTFRTPQSPPPELEPPVPPLPPDLAAWLSQTPSESITPTPISYLQDYNPREQSLPPLPPHNGSYAAYTNTNTISTHSPSTPSPPGSNNTDHLLPPLPLSPPSQAHPYSAPPPLAPQPTKPKRSLFPWQGANNNGHERVRQPEEEIVFRGGEEPPIPYAAFGLGAGGGGGFGVQSMPTPGGFGNRKGFFGGGGKDKDKDKEKEKEKEKEHHKPGAWSTALALATGSPPPNAKDNLGTLSSSTTASQRSHYRSTETSQSSLARDKEKEIRGWRAGISAMTGVNGNARETTGMNSWESRKSSKSVRSTKGRDGERDRERDGDKERRKSHHEGHRSERDRESRARAGSNVDGPELWDITREIGWLTAHASEDWARMLDLCEKLKESDASSKEAARALRKDIKYGEPSAQLSAARLWAIMLRNCDDNFRIHTSSKKFLESLEGVLTGAATSPVVKERLLIVLSAAAYTWPAMGGFRLLWGRMKPKGGAEAGVPFDDQDPMFNPPAQPSHLLPSTTPLSNSVSTVRGIPMPAPLPRKLTGTNPNPNSNSKISQITSPPRIIPPDEDRRRLLEECEIAKGNAVLLQQALTYAKPEELQRNSLIQEFHAKCVASRDIIGSQLDWAAANARKSRDVLGQQQQDIAVGRVAPNGQPLSPLTHGQNLSAPPPQAIFIQQPSPPPPAPGNRTPSPPSQRPLPIPPSGGTKEEQLLAALLAAHAELVDVFKQYDDLERLMIVETEEKQVKEISKREMRLDRNAIQHVNADGSFYLDAAAGGAGSTRRVTTPSSTPSRGPSPGPFGMSDRESRRSPTFPPVTHPLPLLGIQTQLDKQSYHPHLAPPPPPPNGPRKLTRSRSPSPDGRLTNGSRTASNGSFTPTANGIHHGKLYMQLEHEQFRTSEASPEEEEDSSSVPTTPVEPSLKALGKRPVRILPDEVDDDPPFDPHDIYKDTNVSPIMPEPEEDDEDSRLNFVRPIRYAYDAAAERERERQIRMGIRHPVATY